MKAILKFKLPKEKYEYHHAHNAGIYAETLKMIWERFSELEKYGDREDMPVKEARHEIINIFNENNVNIDELYGTKINIQNGTI